MPVAKPFPVPHYHQKFRIDWPTKKRQIDKEKERETKGKNFKVKQKYIERTKEMRDPEESQVKSTREKRFE